MCWRTSLNLNNAGPCITINFTLEYMVWWSGDLLCFQSWYFLLGSLSSPAYYLFTIIQNCEFCGRLWQTLRNQKSRLKDENVIWPILMSGITMLGWSSFAPHGTSRCCNIPRNHDNEMTCWCQQEGISKTCDQEIFCPTRMIFRALCRGEDISGQISPIVPSISNVHTQSRSCTQCDHFKLVTTTHNL